MFERSIKLTVFIHEDLADYSEDTLYIRYLEWIDEEIPRISGRAMDISFVAPSDAPSISSIDYKSDDLAQLLSSLQDKVSEYVESLEPDGDLHKFLLLTRENINEKVLGVAYSPGIVGVASITRRMTAAHEIGHMFHANHEDAESNVSTYNGPARSTMYATADGPMAFRFSEKNQENIRRYLAQYP